MLVYNSSFDEFMLKAKDDSTEKPQYKVYKQRWLVLLAFCAFTFCNALGFVQYTPILKLAASYYDVNEDNVAWFSICYYITYFLLAPFSIKPLDIRLDYSLFFAAFLTSLGQWIIYLSHQNYAIAMIGFILIGIGQIFILAAPAYISDRWFPVHERTVSTCLGSFLNLVGLNFSIFYSSITFADLSGKQDDIIKEIDYMNLIYSIMNTVAFIMCLLMIKNKPPSPPSFSAVIIVKISINFFIFMQIILAQEKMLIMKSFKRAFKNLESILDLFSMSMFIGAAWAYMVVVAILLEPFGYTQKEIGYVSIVYCATGTIGGTIASLYIDYQLKLNIKPHYDILNKAFMTIGMVGILIKVLLIDTVNDTWIIIFSGAIGFGLNSFLPLAIQCYVEKMFPCFELVLTTVMMQVSNLLGFILNYILFLEVFHDCGLWVILIILGPFYIYIIFFFKTKFRRFESEQAKPL